MALLRSYFNVDGRDDPLMPREPEPSMIPAPVPQDTSITPVPPPVDPTSMIEGIKPCQRAGTCPDGGLEPSPIEMPPSVPTPAPLGPLPPPPAPAFTRPDAPAADIAPFRTPNFGVNRFSAGGLPTAPPVRGGPLPGLGTFQAANEQGGSAQIEELIRRLLAGMQGA